MLEFSCLHLGSLYPRISLSKHVHVQFCGKKRVQAFVVVIASSDLSCDLIWWILHALYNQQLLTTRSDLKYAGNKIFWRFVDLPSAYFVFVTKIQRWRKRPRPRNEMLLRNWQTGSPHFLTARAKVKEPELVQFMKLSIYFQLKWKWEKTSTKHNLQCLLKVYQTIFGEILPCHPIHI